MAKAKKRVLILFATGTVLSTRGNKSIVFVDSERDIDQWLSELPELSLLGEIDTRFIQGEGEQFSLDTIERIVSTLADERSSYDGFVVLVRAEHMPQAGSAAEFMLQSFGKPVIFTGSRYAPEAVSLQDMKRIIKMGGLGLRSNIINAAQIAIAPDFPVTAIMFGNRIIKPTKAATSDFNSMNLFRSIDDHYLGRIDFGISLAKRKPGAIKESFSSKLSRDVLIAYPDQLSSGILSADATKSRVKKVLLVRLRHNDVLQPQLLDSLMERFEAIVGFNERYVLQQPRILQISKMTWDAVQMKTRWAHAIAKSSGAFRDLMQKDIIGEHIQL